MRSAVQSERCWKRDGTLRGYPAGDSSLRPGLEPPLGAHVVTPRRGYAHHGIYVGQGRVVQYGGLSLWIRRGPVEEVSLARFSHGRPIWVRLGEFGWQDRPEIVHRARSRLGEDCYDVLTNNCEHFCEWCVRGEHRSYQVDELLERFGGTSLRILRALVMALMRLSATRNVHEISSC